MNAPGSLTVVSVARNIKEGLQITASLPSGTGRTTLPTPGIFRRKMNRQGAEPIRLDSSTDLPPREEVGQQPILGLSNWPLMLLMIPKGTQRRNWLIEIKIRIFYKFAGWDSSAKYPAW
jgi:hypothetical protein